MVDTDRRQGLSMRINHSKRADTPTTVLGRLRTDVRGNTLAIMAASLIPLAALAGSAIDVARMYVVKVRLQQACDAGALAGRKFMTSSNATTLDSTATAQANAFFKNNFRLGWLGTKTADFTLSKTSDQQVAGIAKSVVPMTIMKMFAAPDVTLTVTCEARYDVADTDVMFILDTTGSMTCAPSETGGCTMTNETYTRPDGTPGYSYTEKPTSRIVALRNAVMVFYDTLAANADTSTHIRYGFVPYTSTVNVGAAITAIDPNYLVKNWSYQSRRIVGDDAVGNPRSSTTTRTSQANCTAAGGRYPPTGYNSAGEALVRRSSWGSSNGGTCTVSEQTVVPLWRYAKTPLMDVSRYVAGDYVADPSKLNGPNDNRWQGCIEERDTTPSTSFDPANLPDDLDPDYVPDSDATRWKPLWPQQYYYRYDYDSIDVGDRDYPGSFQNYGGDPAYLKSGYVSCGKPARRLAPMSRNDVSGYVNAADFRAIGGTYHDTGMIWGMRFISPTGIFKDDTAAWPGRNAPNRYIVFMTDGAMLPNASIYGMYGVERYDERVTGGNYPDMDDYTARHNARFLAECDAARARNIRVYVVALGDAITNEERACATTTAMAFAPKSDKDLRDVFQNIATQVAMLRVSK